jgi:hypothetical protein
MEQERYHEWIKRQFEKTRHELATDRRDPVEHDQSMEWIRVGETRHLKSSLEKIRME